MDRSTEVEAHPSDLTLANINVLTGTIARLREEKAELVAALELLVRGFDADCVHNPDSWHAARLALSRARGGCDSKGGA